MPWIAAGASLLSGVLGSRSSSKAADTQAQAAQEAIAEQRRQYDQARSDNAPFMQTGVAANRKLASLMGLGATPSAAQLRAQLLPQYTRAPTAASSGPSSWVPPSGGPDGSAGYWAAPSTPTEYVPGTMAYKLWGPGSPGYVAPAQAAGTAGTPGGVDEAGLQAAINAAMAVDPSKEAGFGDLSRKFATSDLNADPVYQSGLQFGLDEGNKAINNREQARGMYDSGATLKALTKYANDYGSTKANESYNRFNTDQTNQFNRYNALAGGGQTATNQVTAAGQAQAANVGNLDLQGGNARSAGIMGQANAWGGALGGVNDAYQQYQKNQRLKNQISTAPSTTMGYDYGDW